MNCFAATLPRSHLTISSCIVTASMSKPSATATRGARSDLDGRAKRRAAAEHRSVRGGWSRTPGETSGRSWRLLHRAVIRLQLGPEVRRCCTPGQVSSDPRRHNVDPEVGSVEMIASNLHADEIASTFYFLPSDLVDITVAAVRSGPDGPVIALRGAMISVPEVAAADSGRRADASSAF